MNLSRSVSPGLRAGLLVGVGSVLLALSATTRYTAGPVAPSFLR